MKILITGAGGQIGHDLIGALIAAGHDLVSTDLAPRPPSHAHAGGEWQRLDVTDAAAVQHMFTEARPELVFHLAAILSARGEQDPRLAYDVNQTGTWNVLEAARRAKVKRLIFTSSIAVFGPPPSGPSRCTRPRGTAPRRSRASCCARTTARATASTAGACAFPA
jgi:threonine 3-dehydrogenase